MTFVLPPKSQVGVLDPELANEGLKVHINDQGEQVTYDILPVKPVFPDMSKIKSLARYFAPRPHKAFPAWLYHPTEPARLLKNAQEAAELGVCFRDATIDERGRYGVTHVWDWTEESQWRQKPWGVEKFDPKNPGNGKNYVASAVDPVIAQNALVAAIIPAVAAAVAQSLQANGPGKPATIDPGQWDAFLKFQAWQKAQEAVSAITAADDDASADVIGAMSDAELRVELEKIAAEKNIKVRKSWTIDDIKTALDKAA